MADRDPSHEWVPFDSSEDPRNRFCNVCYICTCHVPDMAAGPCLGYNGAALEQVRGSSDT